MSLILKTLKLPVQPKDFEMQNIDPLNSETISSCQNCSNTKLDSILFLGYIPPVNQMLAINSQPDVELRFPLELKHCINCQLVQIGYDVDQRILFPESYPYLSGSTKILRDNFMELESTASKLLKLNRNDLILDIGANDGTLLSPFALSNYKVLGVEPSQAADIAVKNGIPILKQYFNAETANTILAEYGKCQLITAANVFAHITDIHSIIDSIKLLLLDDGVFISENHYLLSLVNTLQYDTVYHEHLRYYSLTSLINLFKQHDLEVFKIQLIPTHGGSIRVFTAKAGKYPIDDSVNKQLEEEAKSGLLSGNALRSFANSVSQTKIDLLEMLSKLKQQGKHIMAIGAPSRASTLINYVGINEDLIDAVLEISTSNKLNKYIPGTRIPVLDESILFEQQPDYALLLSWHIKDELIPMLRSKGFKGSFICPLPKPVIYTNSMAASEC